MASHSLLIWTKVVQLTNVSLTAGLINSSHIPWWPPLSFKVSLTLFKKEKPRRLSSKQISQDTQDQAAQGPRHEGAGEGQPSGDGRVTEEVT